MTPTAWVVAALAVALAAWATRAVVTSGLFERNQVIVQVAFAWLVPVLGPIVLLLVVRSLRERPARRSRIENEQNAEDPPGGAGLGAGGSAD